METAPSSSAATAVKLSVFLSGDGAVTLVSTSHRLPSQGCLLPVQRIAVRVRQRDRKRGRRQVLGEAVSLTNVEEDGGRNRRVAAAAARNRQSRQKPRSPPKPAARTTKRAGSLSTRTSSSEKTRRLAQGNRINKMRDMR